MLIYQRYKYTNQCKTSLRTLKWAKLKYKGKGEIKMYTQGKYIYPMRINPNDIIGKKVGRLKVISYAGYKDDYSLKSKRTFLRKRHFYLCQCECGNFVVVRRCVLQAGTTLSCGCLRREKLEQSRARRSRRCGKSVS